MWRYHVNMDGANPDTSEVYLILNNTTVSE